MNLRKFLEASLVTNLQGRPTFLRGLLKIFLKELLTKDLSYSVDTKKRKLPKKTTIVRILPLILLVQ